MALLYVARINDPNSVGPFPVSATESDWGKNIIDYNLAHQINLIDSGYGLLFDNIDEYNNYVNKFKCTDATILADIQSWQSTNNITVTHTLYDLGSGTNPSNFVI